MTNTSLPLIIVSFKLLLYFGGTFLTCIVMIFIIVVVRLYRRHRISLISLMDIVLVGILLSTPASLCLRFSHPRSISTPWLRLVLVVSKTSIILVVDQGGSSEMVTAGVKSWIWIWRVTITIVIIYLIIISNLMRNLRLIFSQNCHVFVAHYWSFGSYHLRIFILLVVYLYFCIGAVRVWLWLMMELLMILLMMLIYILRVQVRVIWRVFF